MRRVKAISICVWNSEDIFRCDITLAIGNPEEKSGRLTRMRKRSDYEVAGRSDDPVPAPVPASEEAACPGPESFGWTRRLLLRLYKNQRFVRTQGTEKYKTELLTEGKWVPSAWVVHLGQARCSSQLVVPIQRENTNIKGMVNLSFPH